MDGAVASTIDTGWHHVIITTATGINASAVDIGRVSTGYFDGTLDDIRFYSRAISASEATRVYHLGATTKIGVTLDSPELANGLVGHWSFDGADTSSNGGISATGGTITTDGNYKVHTFTSSGTFTVTSWSGNVEYLVVAGGGSGGGSTAGGGGAGGLVYNSAYSVTAQAYTVTVGAGGAQVSNQTVGNNGGNSVFGTITATGGGGGGFTSSAGGGAGLSGGSGGGAAMYGAKTFAAGSGTAGQGNVGGTWGTDDYPGGGGGGAGAAGAAPTASKSGNGGVGLQYSISGTATYYAGGGGGGSYYSGGNGGLGGGGAGTSNGGTGTAGTANTGGGGGGGWLYASGVGGAGGSGIVIVRYLTGTNIVNDTSGFAKNGTTTGTTRTIGKIGQSLSFDGTDDYVAVGNVSTGLQSVSFWIKADNTTKKIIDLNGTAYVEVSAGTITATGWTSPTIYVDGAVASTIDTGWHHITITTATGINASAVDIGRVSTGYFDGTLDDIRFYSRAVSASEANRVYHLGATTKLNTTLNRSGTALESGLVGHWTMDGADMTPNIRDTSGQGNHGNLSGQVATTTALGKIGQSLSLTAPTTMLPSAMCTTASSRCHSGSKRTTPPRKSWT